MYFICVLCSHVKDCISVTSRNIKLWNSESTRNCILIWSNETQINMCWCYNICDINIYIYIYILLFELALLPRIFCQDIKQSSRFKSNVLWGGWVIEGALDVRLLGIAFNEKSTNARCETCVGRSSEILCLHVKYMNVQCAGHHVNDNLWDTSIEKSVAAPEVRRWGTLGVRVLVYARRVRDLVGAGSARATAC